MCEASFEPTIPVVCHPQNPAMSDKVGTDAYDSRRFAEDAMPRRYPSPGAK